MTNLPTGETAPLCSAKVCRAAATHVLVWNNPKIHTPDREKTWLACADHREPLSHHLAVRSFLRRVDPLTGHDQATSLPTDPAGA